MSNRISIVTISFNQNRFLRTAIESILNQNYENLEYIVVDPGSTDGSQKIIEEYHEKINHIIFDPDEGPADGLNKGFALATGDIFGYLNSDDILYPGTLNKVDKLFSNKSNLDVVSAHGKIINEKNEVSKKIYSHKFDLCQYLYENCILVQQSTFFKSSIFKSVNGFNVKNNISWDGELMLDFCEANAKFKIVRDYWSGFRIYDQSISGSAEYKKKLNADYIRLRRKFGYPEIGGIKKKIKWLTNWLMQPRTLYRRIFATVTSWEF